MRVLVVNSHHYRRGGDSAQFMDHVAALRARGHDVAVYCIEHPENEPSEWSDYWAPYVEFRGRLGPLQKLHAAGRGTYSIAVRMGMSRLIRDFRPDVVHLHSIAHHLTLSVLDAASGAGRPIVWTLHDYRTVCPASALLRHGEVCERCAGGRYWRCVEARCKSGELPRSAAGAFESYLALWRGTYRRVAVFVAPSEFLARKVLAMGLKARGLVVLPNPVQPEILEQASPTARRGVLYVGRLSREKGVDVAIRALADTGVGLRVVGDGAAHSELLELASSPAATAEFSGWVEPSAVRRHMAEAQLLCVPSVCYENCPGVVLEAMRDGLPVVASGLGGLVELLDDGRVGWLAPPGDPIGWRDVILKALDDPEAAAAVAERARARVLARHDPAAYILKMEAIYESLSRSGSRGERRVSPWSGALGRV